MSATIATLVESVAIQALSATILAILAATAGRFVRRPAVTHALWLLVLLKLVTPPVWGVELLPAAWRSVASGPAVEQSIEALPPVPSTTVADARPSAPVARSPDRRGIGLAVWALFAGSIALLAGARVARFRRLVRSASPAPASLRRRLGVAAEQVGLRSVPEVRLTDETLPPMVWAAPGRAMLLLPRDLLDRLSDEELDTILAHESAHLVRRDPWIRWLELAAMVAYGWLPTYWWARRRLRIAEERACDALVLRRLPRSAAAYARALLKTVEFLSGRSDAVPLLASGAGAPTPLMERMTMILDARPPRTLSRGHRLVLASIVLGALLVSPTWIDASRAAEPAPESPAGAPTPPAPPAEPDAVAPAPPAAPVEPAEVDRLRAEIEVERQAMERRQAELMAMQEEVALAEDRARQAEIERGLTEEKRQELERFRKERLFEAQAALERAMAEQQREQGNLERSVMELERQLEQEARRAERSARELESVDREDRIRMLESAIVELKEELARLESRLQVERQGAR